MSDSDFEQVAKHLFHDVPSIDRHGWPGTLIPLTNDTQAILAGENPNDVVAVATRFSKGRCLIFAHNGYTGMFLNSGDSNKQFIENCRRWLTHGKGGEFISINDATNMSSIATKDKILVWDGHNTKSEEFTNNLLDFILNGGALICAATAWGWLQSANGLTLDSFPFHNFCRRLGVKVTGEFSKAADPVVFREEFIRFHNIEHVCNELLKDPNNIENVSILGKTIQELGDNLPSVSDQALRMIVQNVKNDIIPGKTCPVHDRQCRDKAAGICGVMCAIPNYKAPGIKEFPGDFENSPTRLNDIQVEIKNSFDSWHSTGYYVAAGIPVQIHVLQIVGPAGWKARIGCHSDSLNDCDEFRRWPRISITKALIGKQTVEIHSPYGGLLFLEPPGDRSGSIRVRLSNVILTPSYELEDSNRAEHWRNVQANAAGLWANIAGKYIVFNLPSKSVLHFNDQQLDRVLKFWDAVVLSNHELRGTTPEQRERIVCDEQPSAGYMHSGYPIVTHLDVSDPKSDGFLFNYEKLENVGSWGLFHELGHNLQRDWWTFEGTGEVTVNLFTLHAMAKVCNKPTWIHSWLQDQAHQTRRVIQSGSNFDDWKGDPGVALFIYAQLAREFGWEAYKKVLRKYEDNQPSLDSDQDKMDYWISTFSKETGKNLVPLFKFWGFPISQSTIHELKGLSVPTISDEFTRLAPQRYAM